MRAPAAADRAPASPPAAERASPVGVVALAFSLLGAVFDPTQFLRSYLVAFLFWVGIALGCMALLMIHHVTGGAWGAVIRRLLEAGVRTLPLMALLFLPIAFGTARLYEWAQPEHVAHDPLLQHKAPYLNVPFFLARAVFYFVAWILMARFLTRWSRRAGRHHAMPLRATKLAAAQPRRPPAARPHDDLRLDRLDDVARAALVLDDLRRDLHGGRRRSAPSRS